MPKDEQEFTSQNRQERAFLPETGEADLGDVTCSQNGKQLLTFMLQDGWGLANDRKMMKSYASSNKCIIKIKEIMSQTVHFT